MHHAALQTRQQHATKLFTGHEVVQALWCGRACFCPGSTLRVGVLAFLWVHHRLWRIIAQQVWPEGLGVNPLGGCKEGGEEVKQGGKQTRWKGAGLATAKRIRVRDLSKRAEAWRAGQVSVFTARARPDTEPCPGSIG